jgi:hypothetical protein
MNVALRSQSRSGVSFWLAFMRRKRWNACPRMSMGHDCSTMQFDSPAAPTSLYAQRLFHEAPDFRQF